MHDKPSENANAVQAPAPTAWPIVLAFGITLAFAGLVTSHAISWLGAILSLAGIVGWFRDVLPHEAHESLPLEQAAPVIQRTHREVARVALTKELRRAWLPVEIHPMSAGIFGRYSRIANDMLAEADCILSVGCKLGEIATKRFSLLPDGVPLVHIDILPEEFRRTSRTEVTLWADAGAGIADLYDAMESTARSEERRVGKEC